MTDQVNEAVAWLYTYPHDGESDHCLSASRFLPSWVAAKGATEQPLYTHPARGVVDEAEPGAVASLVAAANATLAANPHDDTMWSLEAAVAPFNASKPAECASGCPPQQVCDYCQVAAKHKLQAAQPAAPAFDMLAHLQRQREWSGRTFGPGPRTAGVIDHIRKELREIEADPTDLSEWIDVVILALDGAWRAGGTPEQIIAALVAKQTKNEGRTWPDWRTSDPDKAIEHDRTQDAQPAVPSVPEGSGYEVRKGSDGAWGIYPRKFNMRLATFGACSQASRDEIATMLATPKDQPAPRPKQREVARIGDMHQADALRVGLDGDGDAYVCCTGDGVEFCTTGTGGGKSPRTHEALIALMVAMEADNAETPTRDWWARRSAAKDQPAQGVG